MNKHIRIEFQLVVLYVENNWPLKMWVKILNQCTKTINFIRAEDIAILVFFFSVTREEFGSVYNKFHSRVYVGYHEATF